MNKLASRRCILAFAAALGMVSPLAAGALDFSYSGRLVDEKTGRPHDGPIALRVRFFHQPSGGEPVLSVTSGLEQVQLEDGVFQVTLSLPPSDHHEVFPTVEQPVFVEITDLTHDEVFDRQQVALTPFAGKIPVDDKALTFGSDGKLTLAVTAAPGANQFLTKDANGNLVWGTPAVTGIQGREVSDAAPQAGHALVYDGNRWVPQAISSGAGGGATNLATGVTGTLPVASGGTGAITAADARASLGVAAAGANSDITSLSGLTTALSVGQGGTGATATPGNGQLLIGNGTSYTAANLAQGGNAGVTISNGAGSVTLDTAQDIRSSASPTFAGLALGTGDGSSTPTGGTVRAANASGTDIVGTDLTFAAGNGTGSGGSGDIMFKTAPAAASGATANTLLTRMTISETGGVGIGTTAPAGLLDVNGKLTVFSDGKVGIGTTTAGKALVVQESTMYGGLRIRNSSFQVADLVGTTADNDNGRLNLYSAGTAAVTLNASGSTFFNGGNVGVGSTAPAAKLDVNGTVRATNFVSTGNSDWSNTNINNLSALGIGTTSPAGSLSFGGGSARSLQIDRHPTANTAGNNFTISAGGATSGATDKSGGSLVLASGTATGSGLSEIQFQTASPGVAGTADRAPTTKMTITGAGNVGIGTTAPTQALDVNGSIKAAGNLIEKSVTFTPTTAGWYRIVSATMHSGGTVRLTGTYDNAATDVEFEYYVMGFGQQGSIQQTKHGYYNNGVVSQVRISNNNTGTAYLDIYVSRDTAPAPITVYAYGPNQASLVAAPVVGAVAGSHNVATLTLANGFNTTGGITAGGNIGIGTTSPASGLDVQSGTNASGQIRLGASGQAGKIYFSRGDGNYAAYAGFPTSTEANEFRFNNTSGGGFYTFHSNISGGGAAETFRIANDGNVGIGTTSPSATLSVVGTTSISGNATIGGTATVSGNVGINGGLLSFGASGQSMIDVSALNPGVTTAAAIISGPLQQHLILDLNNNDANDAIAFRYSNANNYAVDSIGFVMKGNGNVGIGTTAPSEKLHIVGNLRVAGTTDCTLGGGSGATNCTSDIRLKDNVEPIADTLDKIDVLRGVEFDWNEKSRSPGTHAIGVIAQDVEQVFPTAVITDPDSGYKKVDYAVLVAPLIEAVKALRAENTRIKAIICADHPEDALCRETAGTSH